MRQFRTTIASIVVVLLANITIVVSANAQQAQRELRPAPPGGLPIVPFMEGWYDNEDGSVTISFGYHNRNEEDVTIDLGANNRIEPAQLDGMQPEVYSAGRHPGAFGVTIPASMREETIWWYIKTGNSEEFKVPGQRGAVAYELDRNPRPQGSVQPEIWFEDGKRGTGPEGVVAANTKTVSVGSALTLEVETEDPSVRDPSDPRFTKPLDSRVIWYKHQGPGEVSFTEHSTTPFDSASAISVRGMIPAAPSRVTIPAGKGPARVIATFSEAGEYLIRARLDNWKASDSDGLDQCCWSNAFQRVQVTP
jgi:hypothetical protein